MNSIQRFYHKMGFEQLKLTCCWKKLVQKFKLLKKQQKNLLCILNYQCQHNNDILLHVTWHIILRISYFKQWNARSKTDSTWPWYSSAAGPQMLQWHEEKLQLLIDYKSKLQLPSPHSSENPMWSHILIVPALSHDRGARVIKPGIGRRGSMTFSKLNGISAYY